VRQLSESVDETWQCGELLFFIEVSCRVEQVKGLHAAVLGRE
jgi:hypothetical protein